MAHPLGAHSSAVSICLRLLLATCAFMTVLANVDQDIVTTSPSVYLKKGTIGLLPCVVKRETYFVLWTKDRPYSPLDEDSLLISMDTKLYAGYKRGPGYESGSFDIADNYSLIIKSVGLENGGQYYCQVAELKTGSAAYDATNVTVYVPPMESYPLIDKCSLGKDEQQSVHFCRYDTAHKEVNVTCSVNSYFPHFDIWFIYNSHQVKPLEYFESLNKDGTLNKSLTIKALPSSENYTCVASGIYSAGEVAIRSTTFHLKRKLLGIESVSHHRKEEFVIIAGLVIFIGLIVTAVCCYYAMLQEPVTPEYHRGPFVFIEDFDILSAEERAQCKQDLHEYYRQNFSKHVHREYSSVAQISFDHANLPNIECYIVNRKDSNIQEATGIFPLDPAIIDTSITLFKQPLYQGAFQKMILPGKAPFRILLDGESGTGKTTLLLKIVNDWITGMELTNIELLFYVHLGESHSHDKFVHYVEKYLSGSKDCLSRLDGHIKKKQNEVMFLFDSFNEYGGNIGDPQDVIGQVLKGEKYPKSVVLITSRPSCADQLLMEVKLKIGIQRIKVNGFDQQNTEQYVANFFGNDETSANSLLTLLHEDSQGKELFLSISTIPFYLAILCHMWQDEARRDTIKKLQDISHLMDEIIDMFKVRCVTLLKRGLDNSYFQEIGRCAYDGILKVNCEPPNIAYAEIGYKIGILTQTRWFRKTEMGVMEYFFKYHFINDLLRDFLAAVYIASVYRRDTTEFKRMILGLIIRRVLTSWKNDNLWYFIVSRDSNVAKETIKMLNTQCERDFIVRVASEIRDEELRAKLLLDILDNRSLRLDQRHSFAAHLFALESFPSLDTVIVGQLPESKSAAHRAGTIIFGKEHVRSVSLERCGSHSNEFYVAMEKVSSSSKIKVVSHNNDKLGFASSELYGMGISNMTSLQVLRLHHVDLEDSFFRNLCRNRGSLQITTLLICNQTLNLNRSNSHHFAKCILNMTRLCNLRLEIGALDDVFYQSLARDPLLIEKFIFRSSDSLSPDASRYLVDALFNTMNLKVLLLWVHSLIDVSCMSLFAKALSSSKIEKLYISETMEGVSKNHQASTQALGELVSGIASMPNLDSLKFLQQRHAVITDLCSKMADPSCHMKITNLTLHDVDLTRENLMNLFSLASLQAVKFAHVKSNLKIPTKRVDWQIPTKSQCFVEEIVMDTASLPCLVDLDLHLLSSGVKRIRLDFKADVLDSDIKTLQNFNSVPDLHLSAYRNPGYPYCEKAVALPNIGSVCQLLSNGWPSMRTLRFTDIRIGNKDTRSIVATKHKHLECIRITRCNTTEGLYKKRDELFIGRVKLDVVHGKPETIHNRNYDRYADYLERLSDVYFDDVFEVKSEDE